MSKNPNSQQKKWMNDITEFIHENGLSCLYNEDFGNFDFDRHHVLGRTAKQDKIAIGNYFIIPVPRFLHDVHSNNPDNVTHFKHNFTRRFGYQRELFKKLCSLMRKQGYEVPPREVCCAIGRTRA